MKSVKRHLLAVIVSLASVSCSGGLGINIFPDSKDIELGKQIDQEIRNNPKEYPILQNRKDVNSYLESIGKKILESRAIEKRSIYAYKFEIIKDDSTINAFCTPGGYIYVYTGLMKFLDNEASLAGVLGHEIAHAERRHATSRMTSALGLQFLIAIVLGKNPSQVAQIGSNLFTGLGLLKNSRADEEEADRYSIKYLQSTEYYPGAIRYFFEKVSAGTKGGALERLLSTHPLPQDRIVNVEKLMRELQIAPPSDTNLFTQRYYEMKKTLP